MRTRQSVLAVMAAALVAGGAVLPVLADEPPPPIVGEPLTGRAAFLDDIELKIKIKVSESETVVVNADDPSRTAVVRFTLQPSAQFPWHTHAGPVVVNVVSGALTTIDSETCGQQTYSAGEAFVDAGHGHVHTAFNPTGSPTVLVATFYEAPASGPLLIPAPAADC